MEEDSNKTAASIEEVPDHGIYEIADSDDLDDSAPNFAQNDGEGEEDDPSGDDGRGKKSVFLMMFEVLGNPAEGWKSLRRSKATAEEVQSGCFYPMLAVMAVCRFSELFYSPRTELSSVIVGALAQFTGYFAAYYCIILLLKLILPIQAAKEFDGEFGKVFILTGLSTLALFEAVTELLPMLWAVLIFLPLWTVYSMCRGMRYFRFPENKTVWCIGCVCLLTVGMPLLISYGLAEALPK